jgi:hypothetical protein
VRFARPSRIERNSTLASQLYQERHKWLEKVTDVPLVIVRMGDEAAAHGGFHSKFGRKIDEDILKDIDTPAELDSCTRCKTGY